METYTLEDQLTENLNYIVKKTGCSHETICINCRLTPERLQAYLAGEFDGDELALQRLAKFFNLQVAHFTGRKPIPKSHAWGFRPNISNWYTVPVLNVENFNQQPDILEHLTELAFDEFIQVEIKPKTRTFAMYTDPAHHAAICMNLSPVRIVIEPDETYEHNTLIAAIKKNDPLPYVYFYTQYPNPGLALKRNAAHSLIIDNSLTLLGNVIITHAGSY